jgi:hypothetical protein
MGTSTADRVALVTGGTGRIGREEFTTRLGLSELRHDKTVQD